MEEINLIIKKNTGDSFEIKIEYDSDIITLKKKIEEEQNIEFNKQRLVFKNNVIKDEKISELSISDNDTLVLFIRDYIKCIFDNCEDKCEFYFYRKDFFLCRGCAEEFEFSEILEINENVLQFTDMGFKDIDKKKIINDFRKKIKISKQIQSFCQNVINGSEQAEGPNIKMESLISQNNIISAILDKKDANIVDMYHYNNVLDFLIKNAPVKTITNGDYDYFCRRLNDINIYHTITCVLDDMNVYKNDLSHLMDTSHLIVKIIFYIRSGDVDYIKFSELFNTKISNQNDYVKYRFGVFLEVLEEYKNKNYFY